MPLVIDHCLSCEDIFIRAELVNQYGRTYTQPFILSYEDPATYDVTIAEVVGGTATVSASPDSDVEAGTTVTVTISNIEQGKQLASITVEGDDTGNTVATTEVEAGVKYTFTMPAENVTVTIALKEMATLAGLVLWLDAYDYDEDAGIWPDRSGYENEVIQKLPPTGPSSLPKA